MKRSKNPKPSTVRRRAMYTRLKRELVDKLGGECQACGRRWGLTFDHVEGRDWQVNAVHGTKRLRLYAEEERAGKLQLLCGSCNSSKCDATEEFMRAA